jgi:hypothetical protein
MAAPTLVGPAATDLFLNYVVYYAFLAGSDVMIGASPPYTPGVPNLSCYIEVYEEIDTNFVLITPLMASYAASNKFATFNLRSLFSFAPLKNGLPAFSSNTDWDHDTADHMVKKIMLKYANRYGSPPENEELTESAIKYIVYGGIRLTSSGAELTQMFVAHNYAWSGSSRKNVHCKQPDWVYVYTPAATTLYIDVVIYLNDGSTVTKSVGTISAGAHQMNWMESGWDQLQLSQWLEAESVMPAPWAYDFRVKTSAEEEDPQKVKYRIHMNNHPWNVFLMVCNGMGGFESLWLKGKGTFGFTSSGDDVQRARAPLSDRIHGDFGKINQQVTDTWEVNTGWQDDYYMKMLKQIHLNDLWLIDIERYQFLRVIAETGETKTREEDTQLESNAEIKLKAGWFDEYYNAL